jgi:hypothetical protein
MRLQTLQFQIKENSFIARIAAWKLNAKQVAIVFGKTIHLHNSSKEEFLNNERWLKHELEHIRQYRKYGMIGFITRYLVESAKKGYYNNKFEVDARAAEKSELSRP